MSVPNSHKSDEYPMLYFIHTFYTTNYLDYKHSPCYSEIKLFKNKKAAQNLFNNSNSA